MFCPNCGSEYRNGFTHCADCDVDLVTSLPRENLAPLALETNSEMVADLVDRLEKAGLPYAIEAGTALNLLDDPGAEIDEADDWCARVWVATAFEERAQGILDQIRGERRLARAQQIERRYADVPGPVLPGDDKR
jgi:hypothetical protein